MKSKILAKWVPGPGICTCKGRKWNTKNSTTKKKHFSHKIDREKKRKKRKNMNHYWHRVGYPTLSGLTTEEKNYFLRVFPKGDSRFELLIEDSSFDFGKQYRNACWYLPSTVDFIKPYRSVRPCQFFSTRCFRNHSGMTKIITKYFLI